MAVTSLVLRSAPQIGGIEFDATLEDTLSAQVEWTGYEIEVGARAVDHRIIRPIEWSLLVAVGGEPLRAYPTDFTGLLSAAVQNSGLVAAGAGLAAGFLGGSDAGRPASALTQLLQLMQAGEPFDVFCGDISLSNMVIARITRTRTPRDQDALFARVLLQELPTLDTLSAEAGSSASVLNSSDPLAPQSAAPAIRGPVSTSEPSEQVAAAVAEGVQ